MLPPHLHTNPSPCTSPRSGARCLGDPCSAGRLSTSLSFERCCSDTLGPDPACGASFAHPLPRCLSWAEDTPLPWAAFVRC